MAVLYDANCCDVNTDMGIPLFAAAAKMPLALLVPTAFSLLPSVPSIKNFPSRL